MRLTRVCWFVLSGFMLGSVGCSPAENSCVVDCDGGSTGGGSSGTGGGSSGTGGGTSGTGGGTSGTGGGTSGTGGGGACTESWTCGYWRSQGDGGATRVCLDENACSTTTNRPPLFAALPALDLPFYKCQVHPVLARSCAMVGCHGTLDPQQRALQVFARSRQRNDEVVMYNQANAGCLQSGTVSINLNTVGTGTASCNAKAPLGPKEWAINFDSARAFAIGVANADQNELLSQPTWGSSFPHAGIKQFRTGDTQYSVIRQWLDGGTAAATCTNGTNN